MPRLCQVDCHSTGLLALSEVGRAWGGSEGCELENSLMLWHFLLLQETQNRPFVPWCFSGNNASYCHSYAVLTPPLLSEVKVCSGLLPPSKVFHVGLPRPGTSGGCTRRVLSQVQIFSSHFDSWRDAHTSLTSSMTCECPCSYPRPSVPFLNSISCGYYTLWKRSYLIT